MLIEVEGDLFNGGYETIGHGVNCQGVMGAGIAKEFKIRYPNMFYSYKALCEVHQIRLGDVHPWQEKGVKGYNLATQFQPGANASLVGIRLAVTKAMSHAKNNHIKYIAIPRIGCGIGGLQWTEVGRDLDKITKDIRDVDLIVVSPPLDKQQA